MVFLIWSAGGSQIGPSRLEDHARGPGRSSILLSTNSAPWSDLCPAREAIRRIDAFETGKNTGGTQCTDCRRGSWEQPTTGAGSIGMLWSHRPSFASSAVKAMALLGVFLPLTGCFRLQRRHRLKNQWSRSLKTIVVAWQPHKTI